MTYTFKLSRRLAISNFHLMVTPLLLLCACTAGETTQPTIVDFARGGLKGRPLKSPLDSTLVDLTIAPKVDTLIPTQKQLFVAKGVRNTGDTVVVSVTWTATGGQIDSTGEYNAGSTPGNYRVIGTYNGSTLADTSAVTISALQTPSLSTVILTPTSASLTTGATQQFTASGKMSDGSTSAVTVVWNASGGSISSGGLYTAGQTAGTYKVIATQSGGTLADTAAVTITAPSPSPPTSSTGTTFFLADGETGTVKPPWSWQVAEWSPGAPLVTNSTTLAKNGSRSYKFEISDPTYLAQDAHSTQVLSGSPQVSMGSPNGRYLSGYYSWWTYIDQGFTTANNWNVWLGWMTGIKTNPISNIGLEVRGGQLQIIYTLKNCSGGLYTCPTIPGYTLDHGWYFMTANSPAGIVPFPRKQWVHTSVYYKMAPTNGRVTIWQDGKLIMDLTAPTMNTFGGWSTEPLQNSGGDMLLQFGIYQGPETTTQRMYVDDFEVTDFRPVP